MQHDHHLITSPLESLTNPIVRFQATKSDFESGQSTLSDSDAKTL